MEDQTNKINIYNLKKYIPNSIFSKIDNKQIIIYFIMYCNIMITQTEIYKYGLNIENIVIDFLESNEYEIIEKYERQN